MQDKHVWIIDSYLHANKQVCTSSLLSYTVDVIAWIYCMRTLTRYPPNK